MSDAIMTISNIPVNDIHADEDFNCRGQLLPTDVIDLARDMGDRGLIQPIMVVTYSLDKQLKYQKKYKLVAGFRRFTAAAKVLKWETIPGIIREGLSETDIVAINLSENLVRTNLNIMQEARALNHLLTLGLNEYEIADKVGMGRGWVQIRVQLLKMPKDVQDIAAAGYINQAQIRDLYTLRDSPAAQVEAAKAIKESKQRVDVKKPTLPTKKVDIGKKNVRDVGEVNQMLDWIFEHVKGSIATRALAWTAGSCTTQEFLIDLHDHYASMKDEAHPNGYPLPISGFEKYANDRRGKLQLFQHEG